MIDLKPLGDKLIIKKLETESITKGGIHLPTSAKERPTEGQVLAVGAGVYTSDGTLIPMEVKVGDSVLFGKWAGVEIKENGEEYLIIKESEILAVRS